MTTLQGRQAWRRHRWMVVEGRSAPQFKTLGAEVTLCTEKSAWLVLPCSPLPGPIPSAMDPTCASARSIGAPCQAASGASSASSSAHVDSSISQRGERSCAGLDGVQGEKAGMTCWGARAPLCFCWAFQKACASFTSFQPFGR